MSEKPWLKTYPEDVDWRFTPRAVPLYALLDEAVERYGDRHYLDFLDRKFTFAEVGDLSSRAAKGFQKLGVGKGVHVGLFFTNCPQSVVCLFGVLKAGGTVVNFSPLYSRRELLTQAEDSETEMLATLNIAGLFPAARALLDESRVGHLIVGSLSEAMKFPRNLLYRVMWRKSICDVPSNASYVRFRDLIDNDGVYDIPDIDPGKDIALLQYTGGTTGVPKGAMLTHANIYSNVLQGELWDSETRYGEERMIGALPFFHAFALTGVVLGAARLGAEIIIHPKFELEDIVRDIDRKKATILPGVPTMFAAINDHPDLEKYDLTSLRRCVSGGAPLPRVVKEKFEARAGCVITEGYGLTETSPSVAVTPVHGTYKEGSVGLPLPGTTVTIVDLDDPHKELPLGEIGEICVSGPQVMTGYWHRPEATAQTIVDGRLRTGDIGYVDDDGYLFIVDRKKDLILVGGFNVFPRTVEEAIYRHPAVREVTVIGVPDDYLGERPKAFVVLKDPDRPLSKDALMTFLRERLGKHELPREIEFRDELPKTIVGKLSKKELAEEERARAAPPPASSGKDGS